MRQEREPESLAGVHDLICHHRISSRDFDALASGTDQHGLICQLRVAERSYRYLSLRSLLDFARGHEPTTGLLSSPDTAWDLLVEAERVAPVMVTAILDLPSVGAWVARALRRTRGLLYDEIPLWVDLGYLHLLAAAAGIRCGIRFRLDVPLRHGRLHIPTLGSVTLPGSGIWGSTTVISDGRSAHALLPVGKIRLAGRDPADDPPGWRRATCLEARHRGAATTVHLDSSDPYRMVETPALPENIGIPVQRHWESLFQEAWAELVEQDSEVARCVAECTLTLVPLPRAERFRERSASFGDSFGGVILSLPDSPERFAMTLVHEMQHAKLGILLHLFSFLRGEGSVLAYAPWRDDPRPLQGLLQGIYAFFGVAGFWRRRFAAAKGEEAALAGFEFALWRGKVSEAAAYARSRQEFTALGHRFLTGIATTVTAWSAEPVSPYYAGLANLAAADHRAGWRVHHLIPPPADVASLSRAWIAGTDPRELRVPGPSALVPDGKVADLDTLVVLVRYWLADRELFRQIERNGQAGNVVTGATAADLHLVAGRHDEAARAYLDELGEPSPRLTAWTRLGSALATSPDRQMAAAGRALLTRPELVRTVARAVEADTGRRPAPVDLAGWLGELPPNEDPVRGAGADTSSAPAPRPGDSQEAVH